MILVLFVYSPILFALAMTERYNISFIAISLNCQQFTQYNQSFNYQMDQQYDQYADSIRDSFASVKALLTHLENISSSEAEMTDVMLIEMNNAQRAMILENVQIIRKKNELKAAHNKIANTLREKLNNIDQLNHNKLLSLNSAGYNNDKLYSHRNEQLEKLETLPSVVLNEKKEMDWLDQLNFSRHDLLDPMETKSGISTIEDADIERLQESLYKEKLNRFRLKLIDEKILHRQRSTVSSIEIKWDDRLNNLYSFVAEDVHEILKDIDGIAHGVEGDDLGFSEIDEEEEEDEDEEEEEDEYVEEDQEGDKENEEVEEGEEQEHEKQEVAGEENKQKVAEEEQVRG